MTTRAGRGDAPEAAEIAILDYGMGNLRSVEKALEHVGARALITPDAERAARADGLVLPGVGAFPRAMELIGEREFEPLIADAVARGVPVLGICLGFQLLFDASSELGGAEGLGLIPGSVGGLESRRLKVPHIGWEPVSWEHESPIVAGVPTGTPFYFVHGFVPEPDEPGDLLGTAEHGERFACAVARPPVYGFQFHPEKSSAAGLRLLANFSRICASLPA